MSAVCSTKRSIAHFNYRCAMRRKVCVMNTITKINLFTGTNEPIAVFSSEFTRKIESMGLSVEKAIIKVNADTPKGKKDETEEAEALVRSKLTTMCVNGYELNGVTYKPFLAGASDARKATSLWLDEKLHAELGKWCLCGLSTKDMVMATNKYMAYLGLLTSASKPFAELFGHPVDIRRVAVIDDHEIVVNSKVDLASMLNVEHNVDRTCAINTFDGFGIIRDTLTKGESCTLRGPWLKAFVQATNWSEVAAFGFSKKGNATFVDLFGNTVALKDVDVILTKSCFKAAKMYKSWEQYQNAFIEMNHTICVCVREHSPKLKGMPYQQGQTLCGTEDDALSFAAHAKKSVYKYHEAKQAAGLLRKEHKLAARMYPALLNEKFTAKSIQEKYTSKRNDMLGGRIPEMGYNAFLAPDMQAFVEHLFGLQVEGSLEAGECSCISFDLGPVDVTRNPHLDNAHCILNNVMNMPFATRKSPTMFINVKDMTTIQLRADYDGDHTLNIQDAHLLDLVNRTYEKLNNIPFDWDVGSAPKAPVTRSAICNFITNLLHGSEIGIYADTMTKMWNNKYDRDVCGWLTYAGNVLIDSAKHASVKIKKPDSVKALSAVPLPNFCRYAKADSVTPADSSYWDEIREYTGTPRCAYSGSFLDMYSKAVDENVPATLVIDDLSDEIFDASELMINPHRKVIPGLTKRGTFDPETKSYINCGIFQTVAFRHADEWSRLMMQDESMNHREEWELLRKKTALNEFVEYTRNLYASMGVDISDKTDNSILDAVYDTVVRNIFNTKMTDGMLTAVMQCFWLCFGDRVVKVLESKKRTCDFVDVEFDDDDELFDVSEC